MQKTKAFLGASISLLVLFSGYTYAAEAFEEGSDYDVVAPPIQTEPLVEEFFNYACGACFAQEAFAKRVKANNPNLAYRYVPVMLRPAWKIYVEAYYIGEKLDVLDKSHDAIFNRLHVKSDYFDDADEMKAFFLELGVEEAAYDKVANSYWLKTQVKQSKQYAMKNGVASTPSYLVNKRFRLNTKTISSYDRIEQAMVELSGASAQSAD